MYSNWVIITKLLKEGVSWEAIHSLTMTEMTLLLATLRAWEEEEHEAHLRTQAQF